MASANQLFLLADHIKLSLLERKRAQKLNIDAQAKDGHISRSLDQFKDGLDALEKEKKNLEEAGDEDGVLTIDDNLPSLRQQYDDLSSQFSGPTLASTTETLTHPNNPTLAADFAHATAMPDDSSSSPSASRRPRAGPRTTSKTVRFSDNPPSSSDPALESQLFGSRYTDNPSSRDREEGYRDQTSEMTNTQVHAYHQQILNEQDSQLDALGASISRQRELSMQIGDELDDQVAMLDEVDGVVDRHQSRLDRARRQVGRLSRNAGDCKQMTTIVTLIVILIFLIVLFKT